MPAVIDNAVTRLGRFRIDEALGEGLQGAVYLATDTRLGRRVAVKTLTRATAAAPGSEALAQLLAEARIVGTLSHPNIVPLHDAGEERGIPYLVFEYVEGRTLAALLHEEGTLKVERAVSIAMALAQGVAHAHERDIVHRDLKPGNVMITAGGVPRLMDFGIAQRLAQPGPEAGARYGTPSYMAPEYIATNNFVAASDVFALGVILYEMLAGVPPVCGGDAREILRRLVTEDYAPPSRHNAEVDERLDALVMKALAKQPGERFAGAAEMAAALQSYLEPEDQDTQGAQGTLEYLLRRMRHKGDFPALSSTISAVNRVVSSDREPASVLCNAILRDFALTNRLLKIVNASALNQFGGSISTVSRAVSILGFDAVRNVSMSLILFEHLHDRANADALKDRIVATYFSGLLARELCGHAQVQNAEQAFICAMFHRLGKLLATFYLFDESQIVERHVANRGWDEDRAAREVLGITYEELGVGVAKAWRFPDEIIDSMRGFGAAVGHRPAQQTERLRLVAALSTELADAVQIADERERRMRMAELVGRYGEAAGIDERTLGAAVKSSTEALARDADSLGNGVARSGFLAAARACVSPARSEGGAARSAEGAPGVDAADKAPDTVQVIAQTQRLTPDAATEAAPAAPGRRQAALAAGVQDITHSLVSENSLEDVLRIILETMYRGIGFGRVLLFLMDERRQALRCRFGFGPDVDAIVKKGVAAPLNGAKDLFYAAVSVGADICIEDMQSEKVRAHVPQWYREAIGARGMVLLPIVHRKRTLGLIYADSDSPEVLRFTADELGLLKTLRNQAVLALRQSG